MARIVLWLWFLLCVGLLFSCGLYSIQQESLFTRSASGQAEGPGDGAIPDLSERAKSRPSLLSKDCEDVKICKQVCEEIYNTPGSERDCEGLSYSQVLDIEKVYFALESGDEDKLNDIKVRYLEDYLDIGTDGWLDVIIPEQKEEEQYTRLFKVLKWIADKRAVAEEVDEDILEALLLAYCNWNSSGNCQNSGGVIITTEKGITSPAAFFKLVNNDLKHGTASGLDSSSTTLATIANKELFISLSFSDDAYEGSVLKNFFTYTIDDTARHAVFAKAHNLLVQACPSSNKAKCIRGFYCWLKASLPANSRDRDDFATAINSHDDINVNISSCSTGW